MSRSSRVGVAAAVLACLGFAGSVSAQGEATAAPDQLRYGVDVRVREEVHNNFQGVPPYLSDRNNYLRIRPRLWAELDAMDNVTLRLRAVSEFRSYMHPDVEREYGVDAPWEFPDEVVFDHIYADIRGLISKDLDVRIGRQDLIYGTGKVMLEGTPGDGSRTIYFNAVKATWKGIEKTTIDVFGLYNPGEDPLAIGEVDRNVTLYGQYGCMDPLEVAEAGAGVYAKCNAFKVPFETYGIYKYEEDYVNKATNHVPAGDIGTVGFRVMPTISSDNGISANFEAAYQFGERGSDVTISSYMVDGSLIYAPQVEMKPRVEAGVYVLSGDDPSTSDEDEGWDPLFARYPQNSELYVFWYLGGRWSNLVMPNLSASFWPCEKFKGTAMVANLQALEGNAAGDKERGWLYVVKGESDLSSLFDMPKNKLTSHVWLEVLEPGDFHADDTTAFFARWEVLVAF